MTDKEAKISHEWLLSVLHYDKETGIFRWAGKAQKNTIIGNIAGCKNKRGYLQIGLKKNIFQQHRLAWFYVHGTWPEKEIDHINRIRDDNRITNLRISDRTTNSRNRDTSIRSSTGIKWVCFDRTKKKWRVDAGYGESRKFIGNFESLEDAKNVAEKYYAIHS